MGDVQATNADRQDAIMNAFDQIANVSMEAAKAYDASFVTSARTLSWVAQIRIELKRIEKAVNEAV